MFAAAKKRKLNRRTILDYYHVIRFEKKINFIFKNHCDKQKRFYICSRLGLKRFKFVKKRSSLNILIDSVKN